MQQHLLSDSMNSMRAVIRLTVAVLSLTLALLVSVPAAAQQAVPYDLNGHEGVWMPFDMAAKLQIDAERVPSLEAQIAKLHDRVERSDSRILSLKEAAKASIAAEKSAVAALLSAERLARQAQEERDSWTRSPWLWYGVGVVGCLVTIMLTSQIMHAT